MCKHFVVAPVFFSRAWRMASTQPNTGHDSELGETRTNHL